MAELLEQIQQLDRRGLIALMREAAARLEALEEEGEEWELSPEDREELARRVAAADANPLEGDDWATVRAQIEAQAGVSSTEIAHAVAA